MSGLKNRFARTSRLPNVLHLVFSGDLEIPGDERDHEVCPVCLQQFWSCVAEVRCCGEGCTSPRFHATCARVGVASSGVAVGAERETAPWLCNSCAARSTSQKSCRLDITASPDSFVLDACGLRAHEFVSLRETGGNVSSISAPAVLGVPRVLQLYRADAITKESVRDLKKNIARHLRDNNSVATQLLHRLKSYSDANWGQIRSWIRPADGEVERLWAAFVPPPSREALRQFPSLGDCTCAADDTFHIVGTVNSVTFYAWLAPIPEAGGATMPILFLLHKTGSGVKGDKVAALAFARKYLHDVRMELIRDHVEQQVKHETSLPISPSREPLLLPYAQLYDKDASSFLSHFNDCKILASCQGALDALRATTTLLERLAIGANATAIEAAEFLFGMLPGINSEGEACNFGAIPPTRKELQAKYPNCLHASTTSTGAASECQSKDYLEIFSPAVVEQYGPLMPAIAHVVLQKLRAGVCAAQKSSHAGDFNVAAAQLQTVHLFFHRDSATSDMLRRYFLHFSFICDFHIWQAIERKLTCLDVDMRVQVKDAMQNVFKGVLSWDAFKTRFKDDLGSVKVQLDASESEDGPSTSPSGARVGIFDYFETYWLTSRWWSTANTRFRALVEMFGLTTTSDVELFW